MSIHIKAPASKSVSHRALIAAALAPGTSSLANVLDSQDLQCTMGCLQALGVTIHSPEAGRLSIQGYDVRRSGPGSILSLDVGESGTTCRLITPIAALGQRPCRIAGRGRMHERPIQELAEALHTQGAEFLWEEKPGCPPCLITPKGLRGGEVRISLEQSSQYLSGLLLASPLAREATVITVSGKKVLSWPYVALTLQTMQAFGRAVRVQTRSQAGWEDVDWTELTSIIPEQTRFVIEPGNYVPCSFQVEGDWSNASYFLAAGLLHPQGVTVTGIEAKSLQGDRRILDILQAMGATPHIQAQTISTHPCALQGIEVDMGSCPDLVPTVAVLAALAQGPTSIVNVAHLRIKESDRAQAMATELGRIGTGVDLREYGLTIHPQPLPQDKRIQFCTYADHRVAMSLSLLELAGIQVELDQPQCVGKSFPDFWQAWNECSQPST